ncbi:MAG: hypothetical protein K8R36_07355 [Planctomycetales bacterium]|nr:hypothetical protein [Planctomycetales bacterium]
MRMGSLIALLVIVGLLYSRASRPETWKWLVNDDADSSQVVYSQVPSNRAQPTATSAKPTATSSNENAGPLAADSSPGMKEARKQAALASTSTAARPSTTATGTAAPPVEAVPQTASTTTAAATTAATSTAGSGAKTAAKPPEPVDTLVPGPTDLSPEEQAMAEEEFSLVTDRKELSLNEMAPYWRLFRWTWAQSFADLEKRAQPQRGVLFKQLYETPEKYRGKPIILQLHVKQIVKWDAPENRGNFKFIYEIWGATDQSVSYPYGPRPLPSGPVADRPNPLEEGH